MTPSPAAPRAASPWGVYVHAPWCRIRCPYCAFHVLPDRDMEAEAWRDAVLDERARRAPALPGAPHTLYLGGGTPSRLPPALLAELIRALAHPSTVEITVEANPEDLSDAWLDAMIAAGVTRVSLGVQTLNLAHAARLARLAGARAAARAAALLRGAGLQSWSADLMFALPRQTMADLVADLDALLALGPPHLSLYGLTYEPDTAFARAMNQLPPPPDDLWRDMYDHLVTRLEAEGLHRYEVSNFARPGHASAHNQGYWRDQPYLGLGPSASGYLPDGTRYTNASWAIWRQNPVASAEVEPPDAERHAADLLISGLRGIEGLYITQLHATGFTVPDTARRPLEAGGLLRPDPTRLQLTPEGVAVADGLTAHLVKHLCPLSC